MANVVNVDLLPTEDGVRIAVHRIGPEGGRRAVLVPGAFSNHEFWLGTRGTGFGRELAGRGWEVWAVDPRGHGSSDRPSAGERWGFRDWIRHDLPAVLRAAEAAGGVTALVGHSAGGAAALSTLALYPRLAENVAGLVLVATPAPALGPIRRFGAWSIARMSALFGRFPARRLGYGSEDELRHVMSEWMEWNLRGIWGWEPSPDLLRADIATPALVIAGSGDRFFAPPRICLRLFEALSSRDKTFLEFGRAGGFSKDYGHAGLIVDREARAEVWPKIVEWLERVAAAAPPR